MLPDILVCFLSIVAIFPSALMAALMKMKGLQAWFVFALHSNSD